MVAVATIMQSMAVLSLLAMAATSQAANENLHKLHTALVSDDQCSAGDDACTLNAMQLRGGTSAPDGGDGFQQPPEASLKGLEVAQITASTKSKGNKPSKANKNDIPEEDEKELNEQIKEVRERIKTNLTVELNNLEKFANGIKTKLMKGEVGDLNADPSVDTLRNTAEGGRRRRSKTVNSVPIRRKRIQKRLDGCQKVLDKMWIRMKRIDRLNYWLKAKIGSPSDTPDWVERVDGTSVEDLSQQMEMKALYGPKNHWTSDFEKVIEGLEKQLDDMNAELVRMNGVTTENKAYFCEEFWCEEK